MGTPTSADHDVNSDQFHSRNGNGSSVWIAIRTPAIIFVHIVLFSLGLLVAFLIWFDAAHDSGGKWFTGQFIYCLPYFVIFKLVIFAFKGLLRGGWRFSGIRDVANILFASWLFALITFIFMVLFAFVPGTWENLSTPWLTDYFRVFPKGVLVLDFVSTVFLLCAARLSLRIYWEEFRGGSSGETRRVLVAGAGDAGETIIREIRRMPLHLYETIALVDDDPAKRNITINGVPVLGTTDDISDICRKEHIEEIIIAMPSATGKQLRRVSQICSGTKLKFQSLPGIGDLINGKVTVSQIRPVDINDLLSREPAQLDQRAISDFIRGRKVLVTGAGGSIGSQMCQRIASYDPARLILVEQAENPLFEIAGRLREEFPELLLDERICDIHDRTRVMNIWEKHIPDVIIHAAAHKHVPLMEMNPCEAVKNNIIGTKNVADASEKYKSSEFVMISTDKAVNPSSIMGASKRVAELYVQSLNSHDGCQTNFKAVRFGNVLDSAGSVVPIFRRQIASGGPVTITHSGMKRYFMTIPEATQLVLQAAATGKGGRIFVLDMGEPVDIVDMAREMIMLSGLKPQVDIDIVFTGIRPGEKLFEELSTRTEDIDPTVHPKVMVWKHRPTNPQKILDTVSELETLQNCTSREKIIETIKKIVPEYKPQNAPAG